MIKVISKLERLLNVKDCETKSYQRIPVRDELKDRIYSDSKGKCYLCGSKSTAPVCHHLVPDGPSVKSNLELLCPQCHRWVHWMLFKLHGFKRPSYWM